MDRTGGVTGTAGKAGTTGTPSEVALEEVVVFIRRWGGLIGDGTDFLESLETAARETPDPGLRTVAGRMRRDIEAGRSVSTAMALHPSVFPDLLVRYTRAGEESGRLDRVWAWFADLTRTREDVDRTFRFWLVYGLIAASVIMALMVFILPQFREIFSGMRIELPLSTSILLAASEWIVAFWYLIIPATFLGPIWLWRRRTVRWFHHLRQALWNALPWVRTQALRSGLARMNRVLVLLLECRVPVVRAVGIAAGASGNPVIERAGPVLVRKVADGMRLSRAMAEAGVLPSEAEERRVANAEDEGILDVVLVEAAREYERSTVEFVRFLSAVAEPLVIVGMGLIIGGIVLSVFMPQVCLCNCAE